MGGLLWRSSWRYLTRHPWQLALSITGIALGVAVALAIELANGSAARAFELSSAAMVGKATDELASAGAAGLPESLVAELRMDPKLAAVEMAPVISGYVKVGGEPLRLIGIDPFSDRPFRPYLQGSLRGGDLGELLTRPGGVLLSERLAERLGWSLGQPAEITIDGEPRQLTPVALIAPGSALSRQALDGLLIADIASAQELVGQPGRVDRVDLIVPESGGDALRAHLRDQLSDGAQLRPAGARRGALRQMTEAFALNLRALSLLALLVGVFLIYNATSFAVVQRRPLIGRLRALGASRRQLLVMILGEAALVAVVGISLGLAGGVLLAGQLLTLVTQTINDLYFVLTVRTLEVRPLAMITAAGLGLLATLLGALLPAWEAASAPPQAALARSRLEAGYRRAAWWSGGLGLLLINAAAGLVAIPGGSIGVGFGGLFCALIGGALLTPLFTRGLLALFSPLTGRSVVGRLAARGLAASPSRSWVAIAALALAVSVGVGVGTMVSSFRVAVSTWLESALGHDLYLSPPTLVGNRSTASVEPEALAALRRVEGIAAVATVRRVQLLHDDGRLTQLVAVDTGQGDPSSQLLAGDPATVWPAWRAGAALVSEPFAARRGVAIGDELELPTDRGPRRFEIVGVYRDYASDQGVVMLERRVYERLWDDRGVSGVGLDLAPGVELAAAEARVRAAVAELQPLVLQSQRELVDASLDVFDRTFVVTDVLGLLATTVAFVGVLASLMALELERGRERAVMRAVGMTPGQLAGVVASQTGLIGLVAGLLAIPLGLLMAWLLIFVINQRSFGWSMPMQLSARPLLLALGTALAASLLASLYPAWRQSRTHPAEALRSE